MGFDNGMSTDEELEAAQQEIMELEARVEFLSDKLSDLEDNIRELAVNLGIRSKGVHVGTVLLGVVTKSMWMASKMDNIKLSLKEWKVKK